MRESGPFDRLPEGAPRDSNARYILIGMAVLGLVLIVIILHPFGLFGGSKKPSSSALAPASGSTVAGSTGSSAAAASNAKLPKAPDGFEALSRLLNPVKPNGTSGPYALTLPLAATQTDGRNLALYTSKSGKWERLASATLSNNGTTATGQVDQMPANVAVFRSTTNAVQVMGSLPGGAQIDTGALDVLTTVNPGDFTPNPDGSLSGSNTQLPSTRGTVMPTVRGVAQKDADAVNAILASPALRDAHIAALVQLASQPGNSGVDLDYRSVSPTHKADFSAFVAALADKLHASNKSLSIVLPTPTKTGVTWDTGAYDWEDLSKHADYLKLLAEPDPSAYYKRMDDVVSFLKPKVDMKKVLLVVSRTSVEKGSDGLRSMSLRDGLTLASTIEVRTTAQIAPNSSVVIVGKNLFTDDGATGLHWDDSAFAVSFTYPGRGGPRTVWLENTLSLAFRLDMARRDGFGGVAVDDVSLAPDAPVVWDTLRTYAETGAVNLVAPNGTLLRPVWQVQAGSSDANPKGSVVWKAPPQPGNYDVSLVISDGVVRAAQKVTLAVNAAAAPVAGSATPVGSATPAGTGTAKPATTPTAAR